MMMMSSDSVFTFQHNNKTLYYDISVNEWQNWLTLKEHYEKDLAPLTFHTKYSQKWGDRLIEGQLLNRGSTIIWILFAHVG